MRIQEARLPYIPESITVHLGTPNQVARNVTVPFIEYVKNVASSEIYPTWGENALRANILAQISFALNRVYLEFYRSQGKDFDITSSTAIDQKFIYGRNIFENISMLCDEIFDNYIRRIGNIEPLAAKYCNGTTVTCDGLSQWGSEGLSKVGKDYYSILTNYYGRNIEIVVAPVEKNTPSYGGTAIRVGDRGDKVKQIQAQLNRISIAYPSVPKVAVDGIFGQDTEKAVESFQKIFNLTPDGIVGKATWYKLINLYTGLKKLSELYSDGLNFLGVDLQYPVKIQGSIILQALQYGSELSLGQYGEKIKILQYYLRFVSAFYQEVPSVSITGQFDTATEQSIKALQTLFGLPVTGTVDELTWDAIYDVYRGIIDNVFDKQELIKYALPFAGQNLSLGSEGKQVAILQEYINYVASQEGNLPVLRVDGVFGEATKAAVEVFQREKNLPVTGIVDATTWAEIANAYVDASTAIDIDFSK